MPSPPPAGTRADPPPVRRWPMLPPWPGWPAPCARPCPGGRIHAATATAITVDKIPDAVAVGDKLTCTLPSGTTETHAITAIAGTTLSVAAPGFSAAPQAESGWLIESTTLVAQQFRVVNVVEDKSSDKISFTLTAVQNVAAKYDAIDTSAALQSPPISVLPATTQAPVASVSLSGGQVTVQGTSQTVVTIAWPPAEGADTYRVGWRRNDGEWIDAGGTPGCNMLVYGAYTGTYVASVRAISAGGVASIPTESAPTAIAGKAVAPPPPDRKSTRLNSSHHSISYAVFCLKKKKKIS